MSEKELETAIKDAVKLHARAKVEHSPEEITAEFKAYDTDKSLIIATSPKITDEIKSEFSRGAKSEKARRENSICTRRPAF
jgi:hypothetical protein